MTEYTTYRFGPLNASQPHRRREDEADVAMPRFSRTVGMHLQGLTARRARRHEIPVWHHVTAFLPPHAHRADARHYCTRYGRREVIMSVHAIAPSGRLRSIPATAGVGGDGPPELARWLERHANPEYLWHMTGTRVMCSDSTLYTAVQTDGGWTLTVFYDPTTRTAGR